VGVGIEAGVGRNAVADRDHGAPLGELRAEVAVLDESLGEPVEPLGDLLLGREGQGLGALVDLDPGQDPLVGEHLHERRAVGGLLADRLVVEDHAGDELFGAGGAEQHLAIGAPVVLGRRRIDRLEPLLDRARALVGGEDALARCDQ
jgi:hypothetical protein